MGAGTHAILIIETFIRFLGAQTLHFQFCRCTSCAVRIANDNAREFKMLNVTVKYDYWISH